MGVGISKFLFDYVLKTFSPRKLNVLGANLHLAGYLLHCDHVEELELNDT